MNMYIQSILSWLKEVLPLAVMPRPSCLMHCLCLRCRQTRPGAAESLEQLVTAGCQRGTERDRKGAYRFVLTPELMRMPHWCIHAHLCSNFVEALALCCKEIAFLAVCLPSTSLFEGAGVPVVFPMASHQPCLTAQSRRFVM